MVKCLPEFEYFECILENRNFFTEIRRSKVTDYAALIFITGEMLTSSLSTYRWKLCVNLKQNM